VRKSKIKFRIKHAIKHWRALFKRRRNRATFICITGSSAKSSTTVMVSHILSGVAPVYTQVFRNTLRPHVKMLGKIPPSHRYVVCETGADRHRSLQPMITLLRPSSFKRAVMRAGLSDVKPYCLRHTISTELRARGVPEWEVVGMLGHRRSGLRTSERYARYRPDYLSQAASAIDDYFSEMKERYRELLPEGLFEPLRAKSVLVLQPTPEKSPEKVVGAGRIELPTPAMSTQCSKARRLRLLEKRFHFLGWLKAYERSSPPSS
jgi:hypothetical protein